MSQQSVDKEKLLRNLELWKTAPFADWPWLHSRIAAIRFKTLGLKPAVIKIFLDSLADYVSACGCSYLAVQLKNLLDGSVIFAAKNWQIYRNHDLAIA